MITLLGREMCLAGAYKRGAGHSFANDASRILDEGRRHPVQPTFDPVHTPPGEQRIWFFKGLKILFRFCKVSLIKFANMRPALIFTAFGDPKASPRPRYSRRSRSIYVPDVAKAWQAAVSSAAREVWDGRSFEGPVEVRLRFRMPRPKSHRRSNGDLKSGAPVLWHAQKPDLDNLAKAVLDALTALGVWHDDSAIASLVVSKVFADGLAGCDISISEAPVA